MNSIAIYCGANKGTDPVFQQKAEELAQIMAQQNIELIFGGGSVGLMGVLAKTILGLGGKATGVITEFLVEMEVAHQELTELIVVPSMHERKQIMADRADGVIVLPGGFGTLDEFFEILTWRQLGLHDKPIALLNIKGYFDHLLKQMDFMVEQGFLKANNKSLIIVEQELVPLLDRLKAAPSKAESKWIEKT